MFDKLIDVKRIVQVYLTAHKGEQAARIRKTVEGLTGNTNTVYHFNQKEPVEPGVHKEKEKEISKKQYANFLKSSNEDKVPVEKTRFVFKYNDQTFELDIFKGALKGLAILEIELKDIKDNVDLPPFLRLIKEVTEDKRFSNFNLANKELHDEIRGKLDI
jgi:CYTH domain-containing protein